MSLTPDHERAISARSQADELLRLPSERPLSEIFGDDAATYVEMERLGRVTCGPAGWEALNRSHDQEDPEERWPAYATQVWVINGAQVMRALVWAAQGRDPDEIYTEVYANSNHKELDV